jgi:hypothetical protein
MCRVLDSLRVVLPSKHATSKLHKDEDYVGHEAAEINFWIPVTHVHDSNTLQLESSPGAGDFRAVEMDYGDGLRFNGLQCMHYTLPNSTSSTRVSFDFRCIPRSYWRDDFGRRIGDYDVELALPSAAADSADPPITTCQ